MHSWQRWPSIHTRPHWAVSKIIVNGCAECQCHPETRVWLEIREGKRTRDYKEEKLKISAKSPGKPCPTENKNDFGFQTYFALNKGIHFANNRSKLFLESANILFSNKITGHYRVTLNKIWHTVHHQSLSLNQACKFQVTC